MRCPVCRAENDRGPNCRRCRADLSLLFALEKQRRFQAIEHLLRRDFAGAWRYYQEMKATDKHR